MLNGQPLTAVERLAAVTTAGWVARLDYEVGNDAEVLLDWAWDTGYTDR